MLGSCRGWQGGMLHSPRGRMQEAGVVTATARSRQRRLRWSPLQARRLSRSWGRLRRPAVQGFQPEGHSVPDGGKELQPDSLQLYFTFMII